MSKTTFIPKKRGTLFQETLDLLREDPRTMSEIAEQTGFNYDWLLKFYYSRIPDPSVNRVQELYEKLSGKKIKV